MQGFLGELMTKKNLDQYLKTSLPQASLFYGDGEFWIGYYSKLIAPKLAQREDTSVFYYGDYNFLAVYELLNQSSLFGDQILAIIKVDKKISKKDIQGLLEALLRNPNNSLIIEFYRNEKKSASEYSRDFKEMASVFKGDRVVEVRFYEPNANEGVGVLAHRASELGIQIHPRLLSSLLELQNGDIAIALQELEKFTLYPREITEKDINFLCSALGSVEIEDLLEKIIKRKGAEAIKLYAQLEEEGVTEMELLGALENYFYRLFLVFVYMRAFGRFDATEVLGYTPPPFVQTSLIQEAQSMREKQYKKVFETLIEWREKIFFGKGKESNGIYALNKLQGILR